MSTPIKKLDKKGIVGITSGFGPDGDEPNPLVTLGKRLYEDATETVQDLKEEPEEAMYRVGHRLRRYGRPRVRFPDPEKYK
jgi:hypothetical protein